MILLTEQSIYIISTKKMAGKSVIATSLALKAKELGKRVGYFKPIGFGSTMNVEGKVTDEDVESIREILGLREEINLLCPIILEKDEFLDEFADVDSQKYVKMVMESYEAVSRDKDVMLIEGAGTLSTGSFLNLSVSKLAADFSSKILLVAKFEDDSVVDEIIQARDYLAGYNIQLFGVLLNRIPADRMLRANCIIKPYLEKHHIRVLGVIPEDRVLSSLTVREIYESVGGKVLAGEDGMDKIVQTFLVGAMTMESAIKYFRKASNKIVITGGDRTDLILAALETRSSAVILTGNLYPSVKILPRADELAIPIILVPYDTFTTLQLAQKIIGKIKPRDKKRIEIAKRLIEENVKWDDILN